MSIREINTYRAYLTKVTETGGVKTYTKLLDVVGLPQIGGAPEQIEITTTSDKMKRFIAGIDTTEAMTFEANYIASDYKKLDAMREQTHEFAVIFKGTETIDGVIDVTTHQGIFEFKGEPSVFVNGGGVNEALKMSLTITVSTVITYIEATA